jgi:alkanesulfonate monooxygenase SsuD/methylene tetrahydromethanopterin reductase-like flavin-dependent oxidoreductase (luciferase family)
MYAEGCVAAGRPARGENWRVARCIIVAPTDAEAEERVFGKDAASRYFFTYLQTAVAKAGRLNTIKPRPDMSDEEFTPDVLMEECAIYGSPKTVLDRLIAFRDRVGPFGTVLKMGVDWGGASEAWEREAMTLLAQEVMPKFRQHVAAQPQAAE